MSMLARFVQVTPEQLTELLEEPDSVAAFFAPAGDDIRRGMREAMERGNERLQQAAASGQLAKSLATALDRLDPALRERFEQQLAHLGLSIGGLQGGKGGEAIFNMMQERLGAFGAHLTSSTSRPTDADRVLSLDKAWHGVHYLLSGEIGNGTSTLGQAVLGGTELGEDQGYGPARYLAPDEVAAIAQEISRPSLETEMQARYDPEEMSQQEIYPGGWDRPESRDWLLEGFRELRDFYTRAAAHGYAVVTCLV